VKIVLLVEGQTEKYLPPFLKCWLDSRTPERVAIRPVVFSGVANYMKDFARVARTEFAETDASGVVGLIDFYASGLCYPDGSIDERYAWAQRKLQSMVGDHRFRQHFAVHETEAWLFSQPEIFPREVAPELPKKEPETINLQNPPSRVLREVYQRKLKTKYRKPTEGAKLYRKLDPELAASRCPHLKLLLDDLLGLATVVR
jgi:Domain of unknown function (DUF4276)